MASACRDAKYCVSQARMHNKLRRLCACHCWVICSWDAIFCVSTLYWLWIIGYVYCLWQRWRQPVGTQNLASPEGKATQCQAISSPEFGAPPFVSRGKTHSSSPYHCAHFIAIVLLVAMFLWHHKTVGRTCGTYIRIWRNSRAALPEMNIYAIRTVKNHYIFFFQNRKQKPFRAVRHTVKSCTSIPSAPP